MKLSDIKTGTTIRMPTPTQETASGVKEGVPHFFMVITDPDKHEQVIAVNTSSTSKADRTVVLTSRDYPRLTKESYIQYGRAREYKTSLLKELFEMNKTSGNIELHHCDDVSSQTVKKLQEGLIASIHTPDKIVTAFVLAAEEKRTGGILSYKEVKELL